MTSFQSSSQTFTLAHLSDIHLDPVPRPKLRQLAGKRIIGHINWHRSRKNIHPRQVLDKLVADLKTQTFDHIAVTGDVVNIGLPEEFSNAQNWLEQLGDHHAVSVVPGNHDAYVRQGNDQGFWRWQHFMQSNKEGLPFFDKKFVTQHHDSFPFLRIFGKIAIIGLSSAIPTAPFIAAGKLGSAQSEALAHILARLKEEGYYRLVMLHHPPFVEPAQWMHGLRDAKKLMDILYNEGAELVLHGHTHKHLVRALPSSYGDIPVIGVPSASQYRHQTKPAARYNLYCIEAKSDGWHMTMTSRGITKLTTPIKQLDQHNFFSKY